MLLRIFNWRAEPTGKFEYYANRNNYGTGFTVYDFDKVAQAVNSTMPGIGGGGTGIGEGPKKYQVYLGIFVCLGLAGGIWYKKSASK